MTSTTAQFPEEATAKAVRKRYEGLVTVRTKAVKGKGAWYWAHLEPLLVRNPTTSLPKAVKLRCSLCDAVFSASNPSRTATEHLKRGTCPNIASAIAAAAVPLSTLPPLPKRRKRDLPVQPLALIESPYGGGDRPGLSGGRDDLGALAMLESSVKRLRSPHSPSSSPSPPILSKEQADSAVELLADWFYECCGSVSLSSLESPKFRAFLGRVGLPELAPRMEFSGTRLDAKFGEAKAESEARIQDATFFQLASSGWRDDEQSLVRFTVNLPNRSSVFRKAVFSGGTVSAEYAEEMMWSTVEEICRSENSAQRCVGIVSDKYKGKTLRNLEIRNHWMVNLPCQLRGIASLIKDFARNLPLFRAVLENCLKVTNFVNSEPRFRRVIIQTPSSLLRAHCPGKLDFAPVLAMLEDLLSTSRTLQTAVKDESDPAARMVQSEGFWAEVEAVYSLTKTIKAVADEVERERPLVGQCLPLWDDLRLKIKEWSAKSNVDYAGAAEEIVEARFRKIYHPAMAAGFILDPLNLTRDSSGKYLPPFNLLTQEQEKDVEKLVTRLVSREEAHMALMELTKWRSEGLDPLYAKAVQVKQRDPVTGKMKIANPQSSRLVWETCLSDLKTLGKVATRIVFLEATSPCGFKCNWSVMKWICGRNMLSERAQKMLFVAAHAKLERGDVASEEERDAELFAGVLG